MEKALGYDADGPIFDLQDAVPPSDKVAAHTLVRDALDRLHRHGPILMVRINALETGLSGDDLEAIVGSGL
jgi:citrate lyase subunit beta/citryl-CoA lyase